MDFEGNAKLGAALVSLLMGPHLFIVFLAVLFGWLGYFLKRSGFALTSAILYCVAAGLFFPLAPFLIPMIILGFIAYSYIKKALAAEIA